MALREDWTTMSGEMVQCSPPNSKNAVSIRVKTGQVSAMAQTLLTKIRDSKGLHNVKAPHKPSPYWTLLTGTSWKVGNPKLDQVKTICAVALDETEPEVLQAREKLLSLKHTMGLRFDLWLTINLWLRWNMTALPGARKDFTYWDQCPDQTIDGQGVYWGETANKVSKLMVKDMQLLKELGDYLTSFPALTNNRDVGPSHRVISVEAKSTIDAVLEVSKNLQRHS